jgi:hypothetical protein
MKVYGAHLPERRGLGANAWRAPREQHAAEEAMVLTGNVPPCGECGIAAWRPTECERKSQSRRFATWHYQSSEPHHER